MAWRLKDFLRQMGIMGLSPEDLYNAEVESARAEQRQIIDAIGRVAESRREGFARLRHSIEMANQANASRLADFERSFTGEADDATPC